ncbi:MAG: hypothetical protein ACR2RF_10150 [Geminicoccaceae bacterium]
MHHGDLNGVEAASRLRVTEELTLCQPYSIPDAIKLYSGLKEGEEKLLS